MRLRHIASHISTADKDSSARFGVTSQLALQRIAECLVHNQRMTVVTLQTESYIYEVIMVKLDQIIV